MTCCPSRSAPYLAADHINTGRTLESNGIRYYKTGDSRAALLILPDVWGWNGGRTRAIADEFATRGLSVWVPRILQPPYEGGTDGDGLPPSFNLAQRTAE